MDETNSWYFEERQRAWEAKLNTIKARLVVKTRESLVEGIREMKIQHGLKIISSTKLFEEYLDVCYCDDLQEYYVLDSTLKIHRYSIQGRIIQPSYILSPNMVFTKIIWCSKVKILACYIPDDYLMWILTPECKLIQTVKNDFKIENIFYSTFSEKLIIMGFTNIVKYSLNDLDKSFVFHDTINLIDESCGPLWTIQYSSLISIEPSIASLKIVGSFLTTVYIVPLDHDEDEDTVTPVEFLAKKSNASVSAITALYFHSTSQWIIVGDQQGNVLGLNLNLEKMLTCLQAHKDIIKIIVAHPSICGFITSSEDNILQVWSCNLRSKMESFSELGSISSIAVNESTSSIATIGEKLSFFHMHQLYVFFSPLTATATILFSTRTYVHLTRVMVCSSDGVVRMLSSFGQQLSFTVLPSKFSPLSIAYSAITGNLYYVSSKTKEIFINNTTTIPMESKNSLSSEKKITCIAVYDHLEETIELTRKEDKTVHPFSVRIIIGTDTGELMSLEETTGKYEHIIQAHEGSIKKIYSSTVCRSIFSIGEDKCLKIWKMLPYIETFIVLMNYIYYTIPITDLVSVGFIVCLASSIEYFPAHQLIMYDIKDKINLYHSTSQDHDERILSIATSESLSICATSSKDKTIRIWDIDNALLKILEISISVEEVTFSSLQGDIVFSAGKHLYRIPYDNYLPPKYRAIINVMNNILEEENEGPMPRNNNYNKYEEDENKKKALHPTTSVPLGSLDPSSDIPHLDLVIQHQMCIQLKFRDEDIFKIKHSIIKREKKIPKRKASMNSVEWRKYMNNLLGLSSKDVENIPPHNVWKIKEKFSQQAKNITGFLPNSLIIETQDKNKKNFRFVDRMELNNESLFVAWLLEEFDDLIEIKFS